MEESGVKTEGDEVIPPPPDSLGKKKKSDLFPANIYSTFWDLKPTKKKMDFSDITCSLWVVYRLDGTNRLWFICS